jgi:DNA-binding MarR family transcriptional regulator
MRNPSPPNAGRIAHELLATFLRLRRSLRAINTTEGLSPSQAAALTRLGKGEAVTASALATLENVRPQSMAAIVDGLEEHGLVVRQPDPHDGRRRILRLTDAGQEAFDGDIAARDEWLTLALRAHLDDDELRTVATALDLIARVTQ